MGEEPAGILGRGGGAEARSRTFLGVSRERELRYQQQATLNVAQGKIHPSLLIGEDAVGQHTLQEAIRREGVVSTADADERQHSAVYGADRLGLDLHVCPGNALNQGNHGTMLRLAEIAEAISADIGLDREQKAWFLLAALLMWHLPGRDRNIRGRFAWVGVVDGAAVASFRDAFVCARRCGCVSGACQRFGDGPRAGASG